MDIPIAIIYLSGQFTHLSRVSVDMLIASINKGGQLGHLSKVSVDMPIACTIVSISPCILAQPTAVRNSFYRRSGHVT